jgi:enediyne biosynthesis protein E4
MYARRSPESRRTAFALMSEVRHPVFLTHHRHRILAPIGVACLATVWLAAQPQGAPTFAPVPDEAGITFVLRNGATPEKRVIETMPGGLAAFDYDGDGHLDLFFANGLDPATGSKDHPAYWNRLYRNRGDGTFEDVTERAGVQGRGFSMGAVAGDFDNDGHVDLFVPGVGAHSLYRNRGDGTFEDVTRAAGIAPPVWSVAAAWVDVDNDGRLDLFVVNYLDWSPEKERFCGDRARNLRVYCHPRHYGGLANTLYRNRGDGTFEDVSAASGIGRHVGKGMSVAVADVDGNGWQDIVVTNDAIPNFLFMNKGDGTFDEMALLAGIALPGFGRPVSSMGLDARDVSNDGHPDVIITALRGETFPFYANEGGLFREATHQVGLAGPTLARSGWGVAIADLDNDGWKDVATANSHVNDLVEQFEASPYREPNAVFMNRGGRFEDVSSAVGAEFAAAVAAHRGLLAVDLDNDGRLDLVTTRLGEGARVWRNTTPGRRWLRVRLVGRTANRDGLGAIVRVAGQTNVMTSAIGYASSALAPVHFGMGDLERVERIEVVWPGGRTQVIGETATNQTIVVTEPEE